MPIVRNMRWGGLALEGSFQPPEVDTRPHLDLALGSPGEPMPSELSAGLGSEAASESWLVFCLGVVATHGPKSVEPSV